MLPQCWFSLVAAQLLLCIISCLFRSFGTETKDKLPLGDFLCAVGQLKFRGTSVLFRLPHSCTQSLKRYVGIVGIEIVQSNYEK